MCRPDGTVRAFGQCLTAELMAPTHPPPFDVFAAPMANGSQAVVLFNRGAAAATGTYTATVDPSGAAFLRLDPVS